MKNKTAVQWLEEQLYKSGWDNLTHEEKMNICSTAKLMEKDQIMDSYIMGSYDFSDKIFRPTDYYNETFKSE